MEGGREIISVHERNCPSRVVCILFMSVTYSTDTDIKTVVKYCHEVDVTVFRSFSGLFLQRSAHVSQ